MKHKLTFMAVIMMALTLPAVAQNKEKRTDPDHAQFNIVGTMSYSNGKRYLNDARGKNIQFEYVASRQAHATDSADLVVRFDSVETMPPGKFIAPNGKMRKLDFWRYDEEVGEWIYDSEVRQGKKEMESTMKTNIMLVIDNSKSLKQDFKKVQDAAIEFVGQLYRESGNRDIFRVGVIGFSTVKFTKIRDITPLNAANYRDIVTFIRNLEMENGTALYYSLETALDMLEEDAKAIGKDVYKESRIYAFTDGLDQASVDDARGLSTPTQYFDHLKPIMKGKRIMNMPNKRVHSTIVTVRGDDMTDGQERLFDQRAQEICNDVRKLKDMSQLAAEFKKLAEDLVNSNFILYCYIPVGASGRVGWTFADENTKQQKERKPVKMWMGLGLEGGMAVVRNTYYGYGYTDEWTETGYFGGLHVDMAWPLSQSFSFGGSASLLYSMLPYEGDFEGSVGFGIGALAKINFANGSALLLGAGGKLVDGFDPYVMVGYKFKSPWYITAGPIFTSAMGFGVGIGYSILGDK